MALSPAALSVADVVGPAPNGDAAASSAVWFSPSPLMMEGRDGSFWPSLPLSSASGGVGRNSFCLGMVRWGRGVLWGKQEGMIEGEQTMGEKTLRSFHVFHRDLWKDRKAQPESQR